MLGYYFWLAPSVWGGPMCSGQLKHIHHDDEQWKGKQPATLTTCLEYWLKGDLVTAIACRWHRWQLSSLFRSTQTIDRKVTALFYLPHTNANWFFQTTFLARQSLKAFVQLRLGLACGASDSHICDGIRCLRAFLVRPWWFVRSSLPPDLKAPFLRLSGIWHRWAAT